MEQLKLLWINTGLYQMDWGQGLMLLVGMLLIYLAIVKKFEPLLLLPIGFGALLSNIPGANLAIDGGILHLFYVKYAHEMIKVILNWATLKAPRTKDSFAVL